MQYLNKSIVSITLSFMFEFASLANTQFANPAPVLNPRPSSNTLQIYSMSRACLNNLAAARLQQQGVRAVSSQRLP